MKKSITKQVQAKPPDISELFNDPLIDRIEEGIVVVNSEGTILFSNLRFASMMRVPANEMTGENIFKFVAFYDRTRFKQILQEKGKYEFRLRASRGIFVYSYVSISDMETRKGQTICIVVSLLAEERQKQQVLKAKELSFSIFNDSSEVIMACDEKGLITQVSSVAHRYFSKRLLLRPFDKICPLKLLSAKGVKEEKDVPSSLKIPIFRILQEALQNIAKHSTANLVDLVFQNNRGAIDLIIHDNGQGFDPEEVRGRATERGGVGLSSMRRRAELSGGHFSIESSEGRGTEVKVSWKL